ncbi:hypothetical protein FPZ12_011380 [Amycolatopsis acidicola]|uniref:Uncharacterized protein n=1 Tax=Amycolatopsis acidicola TaxID=2596893 RepID=A0A5N0VAT9_9PSEU|nr:hypothetical protein [Amycolatopsis acidicola]KAA9162648.1 hypothetical protein FPZ12_011380 [Amycolatopsis acidicola]
MITLVAAAAWLVIHVTTTAITGVLVLPGVASILYLAGSLRPQAEPPQRETRYRIAYRATIIGFPLFAVSCGAVWAESA